MTFKLDTLGCLRRSRRCAMPPHVTAQILLHWGCWSGRQRHQKLGSQSQHQSILLGPGNLLSTGLHARAESKRF